MLYLDDGDRCVVVASNAGADERELLWKRLNARAFDDNSYQAKVRRQLAVVALIPQAG